MYKPKLQAYIYIYRYKYTLKLYVNINCFILALNLIDNSGYSGSPDPERRTARAGNLDCLYFLWPSGPEWQPRTAVASWNSTSYGHKWSISRSQVNPLVTVASDPKSQGRKEWLKHMKEVCLECMDRLDSCQHYISIHVSWFVMMWWDYMGSVKFIHAFYMHCFKDL